MTTNIQPKLSLVLYHRPGCHLCEEAEIVINNVRTEIEFAFDSVDIETNLELLERFRFDIPVIEINGKFAFQHRVSHNDLKSELLRIAKELR